MIEMVKKNLLSSTRGYETLAILSTLILTNDKQFCSVDIGQQGLEGNTAVAQSKGKRIYSRFSFYDRVTFFEYLVVKPIVVKRVQLKWFKLR